MHFCRSMDSDSSIPIDTSPDPTGYIRKVPSGTPKSPVTFAHKLTGDHLAAALASGELLFTDHRKTCTAHRPFNPRPPHITLDLPSRRTR